MEEIAKWYIKHMIAKADFSSIATIKNPALLFPDFRRKVELCSEIFNDLHPDTSIHIVETFRSNKLQAKYFNNGTSKIAKEGMHLYGIAVDVAFMHNGSVTYKGDIEGIRNIWKSHGLHVLGLWDALHVQYIYPILQDRLRQEVKAHIIKFQKEMGLTADGIIGDKTIAAARKKFL